MIKGPSFFNIMDAFKEKTRYQYHCPNCGHGPFYTGHNHTFCPACAAEIKFTTMEGDIIIEAVKEKKNEVRY